MRCWVMVGWAINRNIDTGRGLGINDHHQLTKYPWTCGRDWTGRSWEWVTSLGFEWEVYTGKRPWRWSVGVRPSSFFFSPSLRRADVAVQVYIACRLSTLTAIVIDFIGFNLTSRYNCEVRICGPTINTCFALCLLPGSNLASYSREDADFVHDFRLSFGLIGMAPDPPRLFLPRHITCIPTHRPTRVRSSLYLALFSRC